MLPVLFEISIDGMLRRKPFFPRCLSVHVTRSIESLKLYNAQILYKIVEFGRSPFLQVKQMKRKGRSPPRPQALPGQVPGDTGQKKNKPKNAATLMQISTGAEHIIGSLRTASSDNENKFLIKRGHHQIYSSDCILSRQRSAGPVPYCTPVARPISSICKFTPTQLYLKKKKKLTGIRLISRPAMKPDYLESKLSPGLPV